MIILLEKKINILYYKKHSMVCHWIAYLLVSGIFWGCSDTIYDVVVASHKKVKVKDEESGKVYHHKLDQSEHLTINQALFCSSLATFFIFFIFFVWEYMNSNTPTVEKYSIILNSSKTKEIYLLLLSGCFCYLHYFFMLKAFETSSSTVILPLIQFSSVFVLIMSWAVKFLRGKEWYRSHLDMVGYMFILFGGMLPATKGNIGKMLHKTFWNQPFVIAAILCEINHGVYNLLISNTDDSFESNFAFIEFFGITRIMFVASFAISAIASKKIREEIRNLKLISYTTISWTVISDVMIIIGYLMSAMAYQCFYQAGIVSASESSLNQMINLLSAFFLRKLFGKGRKESIRNIRLKLISLVIISVGLYITGGAEQSMHNKSRQSCKLKQNKKCKQKMKQNFTFKINLQIKYHIQIKHAFQYVVFRVLFIILKQQKQDTQLDLKNEQSLRIADIDSFDFCC